ncbi:hypothetical protein SPBR_04031 [Sporothrix brasiliensis 5110]|uniref:Dynamin N-terminal domain-containing protein n=1 Tax=Sporothrix brasiliensis 5110 TaxID=1398154 RepID=A0A0C2IX17_9PEZI|nr:uncharacterized protein SPBR_04031 [Sporothrix brasiliensis 5110]KIH93636.1 hypothetical protein SPBR_04031 [Sporothrix brasiliensis 5110]
MADAQKAPVPQSSQVTVAVDDYATIPDAVDDDRTITDIDYDDDRTITDSHVDDGAAVSTTSERRAAWLVNAGSTATMPIVIDDVADAPPTIANNPHVHEPNIKVKKEDDDVEEVEPPSAPILRDGQDEGIFSILPLPKQEDGRAPADSRENTAADDTAAVAVAAAQHAQQHQVDQTGAAGPNKLPPRDLFAGVDVDSIDLSDIYEHTLGQPDMFSMDQAVEMQPLDDPPAAKHHPAASSCEAHFTALGDDWLNSLVVTDAPDDNKDTLSPERAENNVTVAQTNAGEDTGTDAGQMEAVVTEAGVLGDEGESKQAANGNTLETSGVGVAISSKAHTAGNKTTDAGRNTLVDMNVEAVVAANTNTADNAMATVNVMTPVSATSGTIMDSNSGETGVGITEVAMAMDPKTPQEEALEVDRDNANTTGHGNERSHVGPSSSTPAVAPEEAVATQLAAALRAESPRQEPGEAVHTDAARADAPQDPAALPAMDIDTAADTSADTSAVANADANADANDSIFVDPHPEVDQEDLDLEIDDVENSFAVQGPGYAWNDVATMTEGRGIRVLEEAVTSATAMCHKVVAALSSGSAADARINAAYWKREFARICEAQDAFAVHVGVSGGTGAGKTTLINALLNMDELLPSGSDGAATATVCRVHKARATDKETGTEADVVPFRAVVTFKTEEGMCKWLEPILADVADYYQYKDRQARREAANAGREPDSDDDDDDDCESGADDGSDGEYIPPNETKEQRKNRLEAEKETADEREARRNEKAKEKEIKQRKTDVDSVAADSFDEEFDEQGLVDKLVCVEAVFGLGLEHLHGWTVEKLLNKDKFPIAKCVGRTKTVSGDEAGAFSRAVKPYLDSTPIPDDYDFEDFDSKDGDEGESDDDDEDDDEGDEDEEGGGEVEGEGEDDEEAGDEDEDSGGSEQGEEDEDDVVSFHMPTVLWPIVDQVDIYLRDAPLLANGIVLTDLPGLGDANEDRANVAKACFDKLDITMVVTPAIRASDESCAVNLLSDSETMHLRLSNRLGKRKFCVVTSKTDDLDWEKYITSTVQPPPGSVLAHHTYVYSMLEAQLEKVAEQLQKVDDAIVEMDNDLQLEEHSIGADATQKVRTLNLEIVSTKAFLPPLHQRQRELEAWLTHYTGLLAFRATEWRSRKIRRNIQETFRRKTVGAQAKANAGAKGKGKAKDKTAGDGEQEQSSSVAPVEAPVVPAASDKPREPEPIDVLPVSAGAYWKIRKHKRHGSSRGGSSKFEEGFPNVVYTGVPTVRAWIRAATIPMRQKHATTLLKRLTVLLNQLKTGFGEVSETASEAASAPAPVLPSPTSPSAGANTNAGQGPELVTPIIVQAAHVVDNPGEAVREILAKFQEVLGRNLDNCTKKLEAQVSTCNPMIEAAFNQPAVLPSAARSGSGGADEEAAPGEGGTVSKARRPNFSAPSRLAVIAGVKSWQYRTIMKNGLPRGATVRNANNGKSKHKPDMYATTMLKGVNGRSVRMPWATHAAIIRRQGGPYLSMGKLPGAYMWMRGMTDMVLADVVGQWEASLQERLPRETETARRLLLDAWSRALARLRVRLPPFFAGSEAEANLRQHLLAIFAIRDCAVDAAQTAMEHVAEQGKGVAILVEGILAKGWKATFKTASELSGKGVFDARQSMMEQFAIASTTKLVKKTMQAMDTQYRENVGVFKEKVSEICEESLVQIQQEFVAMMRRVAGTNSDLGFRPRLDERARRIQGIILNWEGDWKAPDACAQIDVDVDVDVDSGGGSIGCSDEASSAMPTEYPPGPVDPSLEDLLPDITANVDDGDGDGDCGDEALNADLMVVPGNPKRANKRKAANDGGKTKAPGKKRKTAAAPKKAAGKAASGKAAANKAGGSRGGRGGKGAARGGRGGKGGTRGGNGRGRGKS